MRIVYRCARHLQVRCSHTAQQLAALVRAVFAAVFIFLPTHAEHNCRSGIVTICGNCTNTVATVSIAASTAKNFAATCAVVYGVSFVTKLWRDNDIMVFSLPSASY